jgi:hypothetical protein
MIYYFHAFCKEAQDMNNIQDDTIKIVSRKSSKEARQRAHALLASIHNHPSIKGKYVFYSKSIGSGKRRFITTDADGKYDLDFQIVLTKKSKAGDDDADSIKQDFFQAFTDKKKTNEKIENSTTVVTVLCSKEQGSYNKDMVKFSFDIVIINIAGDKRIKRNESNHYVWTQLTSKNSDIYERYGKLTKPQQRDLLENHLYPKVVKEKKKLQGVERIPTYVLFMNTVNEYKG